MNNFFKEIGKKLRFLENPRVKFWTFFLIIISFVGEVILRKISHLLAGGLLSLVEGDITGPGSIIDKIFSIGAPLIFIYIPLTILLWTIIRDGFQKWDWILAPVLIGIILKGGVYGIISFRYKTGEYWELLQHDVSGVFLWFFILTFLISGLIGVVIWFKEIFE